MDLRAYVEQYSSAALKVLASRRGISGAVKRFKADLVPLVAEKLFDREFIAEHLRQISHPEGLALAETRRGGGKISARALETVLRAQRVKEPREILRALMTRGLLLYSEAELARRGPQDLWGVGYNWGPSEDRELWLPPEVAAAMDGLELPEAEPEPPIAIELYTGVVIRSANPLSDAVRDTYTLVQAVARKPLVLTRIGGIRRADWNRLNKELASPEALSDGSYGTVLGRNDFLFSILFTMGLLVREENEVRVGAASSAFFTLPPVEQAKRFLEAWLGWHWWEEMRRLRGVAVTEAQDSDYPDEGVVEAARRLITKTIALPDALGHWLSLRSFLGVVRQRDVDFLYSRARPRSAHYYYDRNEARIPYGGIRPADGRYDWRACFDKRTDWDKVEGAFITNLLEEPLKWLGIVEVGLDAAGTPVAYRLTRVGAAALGLEVPAEEREEMPRGLVIQPNFEMVLLTDITGFGAVAELDRFAERLSMDRAVLFRLTRESVYRGLRGGLTMEMILARLDALNQAPLPQNVHHALQEWGGLYGSLRLRRAATVVTADTPEELQAAARAVGSSTPLGPGALLVEPGAGGSARLRRRPEARWCDYSVEPANVLRVSPDGRLAVPPKHLTPYLRYRLAGLAVPETEEGVFLLDRERVRASVRGGVGVGEIEQFLETAAAESLPADVRLMLRAWGGVYRHVGISPVVAVSGMPALLDLLAASEVFCGAILARPAPGVALVDSAQAGAVRAAMERLDLTIGSQSELIDLAASAVPTPNAESLYVMPTREVRAFLERAAAEKREVIIAYLPWNAKRLTVQRLTAQEVLKTSSSRYALRALVEGQEHLYEISTIQGVRIADT